MSANDTSPISAAATSTQDERATHAQRRYVDSLVDIVDVDVDSTSMTQAQAAQVIHRLTEQIGLVGAP